MDAVKSRTRSPSELRFGSLLVYAPRATSELSAQSQQVVRHIKNCRPSHVRRVGLRFSEQFDRGMFRDLLGPDVLLVPAPRSSPTVKSMNWPALQISRELEARGLCSAVACLLERHERVPKSALATKGKERPSPEMHATSMRCTLVPAPSPARITIVDDIVTRGSTLLGCAWILAEEFPLAPIYALAVVRTISDPDIASILAPVDNGRIYLRSGAPRREP